MQVYTKYMKQNIGEGQKFKKEIIFFPFILLYPFRMWTIMTLHKCLSLTLKMLAKSQNSIFSFFAILIILILVSNYTTSLGRSFTAYYSLPYLQYVTCVSYSTSPVSSLCVQYIICLFCILNKSHFFFNFH